MEQPSDFGAIRAQQYWRIVEVLRGNVGEIPRLPPVEETIARLAVDGWEIHDIAAAVRLSEEYVWQFLQGLADRLAGRRREPAYETGGLGADTDPGVTGGYGDTGFGALGAEPPLPTTEEAEVLEREFLEQLDEHVRQEPPLE